MISYWKNYYFVLVRRLGPDKDYVLKEERQNEKVS